VMKSFAFFALWLFSLAVNGYDLYFAYRFQSSFLDWEANPIARAIFQQFGFAGLAYLKIAACSGAVGCAFWLWLADHDFPCRFLTWGVWLISVGLVGDYLYQLLFLVK